MQENKYTGFRVEDFVWDEDFRQWINYPTPSSDLYWNEWMINNPHRTHTVDAARQIIESIHINETAVTADDVNKEIDLILKQVQNRFEPEPQRIKSRPLFVPVKIAAVFILLMGVGVALYYYFNLPNKAGTRQISSNYGAIKKIVLPDSSVIVLNGNSKISLSESWNENKPREIWLDGEGYFNVKHLNKSKTVKPGERFIVHVQNINVEVLGTTFDIRQRRNKIIIVLNTGSIRVYAANRHAMVMVPGDMATFSTEYADSVTISKTESKDFSSWTEKKLMVSNASVKEIFQYLEDNYGKKIEAEDPSVMNHKIEGTIMLDNLDDALFVLSKVLNVKIYNNENSIVIKNK